MTRTVVLLTLLLMVFPLSQPAVAQDYDIRTGTATNLRTAPDLTAAVGTLVPQGTTLTVIDQDRRWLNVRYNGRDLWMAGWLPYTKLDPPTPLKDLSPIFDEGAYTLFPDCDPDQFRAFATRQLNVFYVGIEFLLGLIETGGHASIISTHEGTREATRKANHPLLPCRQAIELNVHTQRIITDIYLLDLIPQLRDSKTTEIWISFMRGRQKLILELTPFYTDHRWKL